MKATNLILCCLAIVTGLSCKKQLNDQIYSELTQANAITSDQAAVALDNSLYGAMNGTGWDYYATGNGFVVMEQDATTDEFSAPASSGKWWQLENLVYTTDDGDIYALWTDMYKGISNANYIKEYMPKSTGVTASLKARIIAEAQTGIGLFYKDLVDMYGDVPLVTSYDSAVISMPARTAAATVLQYAKENLWQAIPVLPVSYSSADYGRFTQGAAEALLMKIYLMEKRWDSVLAYANMIIPNYSLSSTYAGLFSATNHGNSEFILVRPSFANFYVGNAIITYAMPTDYQLPTGVNIQEWNSWRIQKSFYDSFDSSDIRKSYIQTKYPNTSGDTTYLDSNYLYLKYGWDPSASIVFANNDIPIIRLADVLLAKAEALNQLNGPTQQSIDLVNQIRNRAFNGDASKYISLSQFPTQQALDDRILAERGWELYFEGHRRTDLIRHGSFLTVAQSRGALDVSQRRLYFPIPQAELNANPNLVQTTGY